MNTADTLTSTPAPVDDDLAAQARPGHGIPSQDPSPEAQLPLQPHEADREARSTLMGGGVVAGAAAGAAIGVAVAGPVGVLAGALGGAAAGGMATAEDPTGASAAPTSVKT